MILATAKIEKQSTANSTVLTEEFEDTIGVIRIRKSKKDILHNGQKKKTKMVISL